MRCPTLRKSGLSYDGAMKRCGHVAIIGRPNTGKSTLLNRLIGEKIAIVSDKPQTTRHRLLGVLSLTDSQLIFVDTPGVHRPGHQLNRRMMDLVYEAVRDVDVVIQMVDASVPFGKGEQFVVDLVRSASKPVILALNKVDLINKARLLPLIEAYKDRLDYVEIIPISALCGDNVDVLIAKAAEHLPERDFLYPPDYFTDQRERSMASEIIREKVLEKTRQELPYATAVAIDEFDESQREEGFVRISASILVDRHSQKKIVIGRGGKMIKEIGIAARKDLQELLQVPRLYLDLNVRVEEGWRDRQSLLDELGAR